MLLMYCFLEMEKNWLEIIKERLRRNCESSVTKYFQHFLDNNGIFKRSKECKDGLEISVNIPIVYQYKFDNSNSNEPLTRNSSQKMAPLSMILLNKKNSIVSCNFTANKFVSTTDTWHGFGQFEESYKKYTQGENIFHIFERALHTFDLCASVTVKDNC